MIDHLHTLVGAYALDALTPPEELSFEDHLDSCASCREELQSLRATAARLGSAAAVPPAPGVRIRLMEAVRRTPQERPRVVAVTQSRWRRQLPLLAAAAAVLAVVASLGAFAVEQDRVNSVVQAQSSVSQVLGARDAQDSTVHLQGGGRMRVVSSPALDSAVVVMADLPDPGESSTYQLWQIGASGRPMSAGVIDRQQLGQPALQLLPDLQSATALAVTVEPVGGSTKPTTRPLATVDLTKS